MSRVGQNPIKIPEGVTVSMDNKCVTVKGKLGELYQDIPEPITVSVSDGTVTVGRKDDLAQTKSFHGLIRNLISNMVDGVSKGFSKDLEIQGVGFKASVEGQNLLISLGFSSPVKYTAPKGVKVTVEGGISLVVSGADKQAVGDVAARIRSFFPAEPYKGKGIRYKGERVRRKVGKTVA